MNFLVTNKSVFFVNKKVHSFFVLIFLLEFPILLAVLKCTKVRFLSTNTLTTDSELFQT